MPWANRMNKIISIFVCLVYLFATNSLFSQTYNNEWINYNQRYFKIPIFKTGLYKIGYQELVQAGVPLNAIQPDNLQLFQRGTELPIYFEGSADGIFNAQDYFIFYAEKNTCKEDSILFYYGNFLANPYHSVINDTAAVFLTWNSSTVNKRYEIFADTNFTNLTPQSYFIKEDVISFNQNYYTGPQNAVGTTDPRYSHGEGLSSIAYLMGQNCEVNFNTSTFVQGISPINFSVVYSGMSNPSINPDHDIQIEYKNSSGNWISLNQFSFDGYKTFKNDLLINETEVENNLPVRIKNLLNPNYEINSTRLGIHYFKISYPSSFNFNNSSEQLFSIPDAINQASSFLNISGFNRNGSNPILIDLTNKKWIITSLQNGTIKGLVPNSINTKKCLLTSYSQLQSVSSIIPVNETGFFTNYSQFATDSAYLIITHPKLMNAASQYASYRSSVAGGSNNVVLASIKDLNDQFAYGVNGNPLAIKNFCSYLISSYPTSPKNLFLIGKSVHVPEQLILSTYSSNQIEQRRINGSYNLVQSLGYPASDNLLTQGITSNLLSPQIATGRISATNDSTVLYYLNKIIQYEAQPKGQSWQKDVLHLVGGNSAYEQNLFSQYMESNAAILRDTLFGGSIYTFKKNGSAPIDLNTNDSIRQIIENGTALITFFGHGAVAGFEQNIDEPSTYNNAPRFPLLISNSCYTGDYHLPATISASEKFVMSSTSGTIGFLATVSTGVTYALNLYTQEFYRNFSWRNYGNTYGNLVKETIKELQNLSFTNTDSIMKITLLEVSLQGDPAVKPIVNNKPDFEIKNQDISIDSETLVDSISVSIRLKNNGKAVNDSIMVQLQRILPNGSVKNYLRLIKSPYNTSTLNFNIDKDIANGIGLNKFFVEVDHYNQVNESNENNNTTSGYINEFIRGADISPVFPYHYAIVPDLDSVILKASTADPLARVTTYRIQLDTNDLFLNPIINTTITSGGGVIKLNVQLLNSDSLVYFWRVSKDTINAVWRESSFQTIQNKKGWSQAQFHQFKNNTYQFVSYNKPLRKFEFKNTVNSIFCRTGAVGNPNPPYLYFNENAYYFNNLQQNVLSCGGARGWSFVLFDSLSGNPIIARKADTLTNGTYLSQYNSCSCREIDQPVFDFSLFNSCGDRNGDTIGYLNRLEEMLNAIPNGTRVLAYTRNTDPTSKYPPSLIQAFRKIGSDSIQLKTDTTNIIISGIKRSVPHLDAKEALSGYFMQTITLTDTFSSNWSSGYILSEIIGPSTKWRSLHWNYTQLNGNTEGTIFLKIIGIKSNGQTDTLAYFPSDSLNILNLENYIDANVYPNIKLIAFEKDNINYVPPQLKKWQVIYDEVPECAINIQKAYSVKQPKVNEGESVLISVAIDNIGNIPFHDSLIVTYWLEDANGGTHPLPNKFKNNFQAGTFFIDSIIVNTLSYPGKNALWIHVNPVNNLFYQTEQFSFNNIIRIPFEVIGDKVNPLLDVTFDGIHILNGDIVSPTPTILISLKDENRFLALNDTSDFSVFIKKPNSIEETKFNFNNDLLFTPAQLPDNSCKIELRPNNLTDGTYQLRVQAKDRSSNLSGSNDYQIQFEVINKSSITELLNYPNPFSTSTRFVFVLTGNKIPETFKIQIMTITGKVVKEIEKEELGTIRIGRNVTEYTWNGKDEFGDPLANGVYLYRVITKINGVDIEKKATSADEYFKNGWGKMVIIR
jgi:hypothetical protein